MERSASALLATAGAIILGLVAAQLVPTRPQSAGDDWRDKYPAPMQADGSSTDTDYFLSDSITVASGPPSWLFGTSSHEARAPDYPPYSGDYDAGLAPEPEAYSADNAGDTIAADPERGDRAEESAMVAAAAASDVRDAEAAQSPGPSLAAGQQETVQQSGVQQIAVNATP